MSAQRTRAFKWLLLMSAFAACSGNAALVSSDSWQGAWKDSAGGIIAMSQKGGIIDLSGTDAASIYRCVCIIDPKDRSTATCAGDGTNFAKGFRFTYRSKMKMNADGTIAEEWEAMSAEGPISGAVTFSPAGMAVR